MTTSTVGPIPQQPSLPLLLTIFLLTMLEFLQVGMVAFAAGPIMGEIGASPEEFSLATAAYACVAVTTISKQRWLVERIGWRSFVLCSLAVFVVGSAICAAADSYPQFLVGRLVMGAGGAAFMTAGRVIVNLIPPSPKRFTGIKFFATGLGAGIAFAPGLAAASVAHDHWRAVFLILIAAAAMAASAAALSLPRRRVPPELRSQSHPVIFISLAAGSFVLLYVVQRSQYDFASNTGTLLVGLGIGMVALTYFVRALARHDRPLIGLKHLRHPRYISGVALFTLCYVLLGANNYVLPMLMQRTLGFPWHVVGQIQTIGLLSALVSWLLMAWMLPKWPGPKKFLVGGFVGLAIFGWQLSRIDGEVSLWTHVLPALTCNGVFLMFVMATTAIQTFRDVQQNETVLSHAQQLKNMLAQFGTAVGIAASTLLLQVRSTEHYNVLNNRLVLGHPIFTQSLHDLTLQLASRGAGTQSESMAMAYLAQSLGQQANLLACIDYFQVVTVVGVLGALVMLCQRLMR